MTDFIVLINFVFIIQMMTFYPDQQVLFITMTDLYFFQIQSMIILQMIIAFRQVPLYACGVCTLFIYQKVHKYGDVY